MTKTPIRRSRFLAVVVAAALLSACSGGGDGTDADDAALPVPTPAEETPEPEETLSEEDIRALEDLHDRYWTEIIAIENGAPLDGGSLLEFASPDLVEEELSAIASYHREGFFREGEPAITDVTVLSAGEDSARVESCVNEDDWPIMADGVEAPIEKRGATPRAFLAERTPDGWILVNPLPQEEAEISC
ncbi:hypothetical protein [Streptomyces calidiresistens]|uniref:Nuclear transport factor 2 family protein n=1 Tax=Streptomyces calidiresistens TaxID=1485586 RepID=A0A7W3XVP2_9ACTN|nr:hypothetical protein [Streptomyces calidiresistens]MBB0228922.1 hypothetical protein [Streptomyces calidiresistens]